MIADRLREVVGALRWTGRIWSLASVLLIIAFIVGERSLPSTSAEWLGFLFFPFGITIGMLLAWWNERDGGIVTVGSVCAFYVLRFMTTGAFPGGWAWLVLAAPGFLFVAAWLFSRRENALDRSQII